MVCFVLVWVVVVVVVKIVALPWVPPAPSSLTAAQQQPFLALWIST